MFFINFNPKNLDLKIRSVSWVVSKGCFRIFFCLFAISWAASAAYGGSQARGRTGAIAASLRQSHSNVGSEPCLQPTPQLTAVPDPQPTEQG